MVRPRRVLSYAYGIGSDDRELVAQSCAVAAHHVCEAPLPLTRCKRSKAEEDYSYWNVVMAVPPLTITRDEVDEGLAILDEALAIADEYVV